MSDVQIAPSTQSQQDNNHPKWQVVTLQIACAAWTLMMLFFYILPKKTMDYLFNIVYSAVPGRGWFVAKGINFDSLVRDGLILAGAAMLTLLFWIALRYSKVSRPISWLVSLGSSVVVVGVGEVLQFISKTRIPSWYDIVVAFIGIAIALFIIAIYFPLEKLLPWLVNRVNITYILCGVITTVINIVIFGKLYEILDLTTVPGVANTIISNVIAWIAAVTFAYLTSKFLVFQTTSSHRSQVIKELILFFAARLFSLVLETAGAILLINVMHVGPNISKLLVSIIVVIANFFFSKWVIFKEDPEHKKSHEKQSNMKKSEEVQNETII